MIDRRPHVGWEVRCDARGCSATTATITLPVFRLSPERAVKAATACGGLPKTVAGRACWVCPLHQRWDVRVGRWVIPPMTVRA